MDPVLTWLKAAADHTRVRLLALLAQGDLTVSELVHILDQSQPRISRHLKLLCDAGLLSRFQEGTWVFYRLERAPASRQFLEAVLNGLPEGDPVLKEDRAGLADIRRRRFEDAQAYFKDHAATWSEIRALYVPESEVEGALLDMTSSLPLNRLLDVGTGTGRILELFADRIEDGVGIDVSRDMLAFARARLDENHLSHCSVQQGDMYDLPLKAESRDLIVVHQVMHFAEEPASVIVEAARVLAPGGSVIVVDFAPHDEERLRTDHQHRRLGFADDDMTRWAVSSGLNSCDVRLLEGGQLSVYLWRFEKPYSPQMRAVS